MPWYWYFLIWWAGMIPQAFLVGRLAKHQAKQPPPAKPYSEAQVVGATVLWPLVWIISPVMFAFTWGASVSRKRRPRDTR